jgi:hypothetical protein
VAGLVAATTAATAFNDTHAHALTIPADALARDSPGAVPIQRVLGEALIERLDAVGRRYVYNLFTTVAAEHKADAIQYVRCDVTKNKKYIAAWPHRLIKVWMGSHAKWQRAQPPTWSPPLLNDLLARKWHLPIRDATMPESMLHIFVQVGVLALVLEAEEFEILGDSMLAVETSFRHAFDTFRTRIVLSPGNVAEYKQLAATGGAPAGSGPHGAYGWGKGRSHSGRRSAGAQGPAAAASASSAGASAAASAARLPSSAPAPTLYYKCMAPNCPNKPPTTAANPTGSSKSPFCATHSGRLQPSAGARRI